MLYRGFLGLLLMALTCVSGQAGPPPVITCENPPCVFSETECAKLKDPAEQIACLCKFCKSHPTANACRGYEPGSPACSPSNGLSPQGGYSVPPVKGMPLDLDEDQNLAMKKAGCGDRGFTVVKSKGKPDEVHCLPKGGVREMVVRDANVVSDEPKKTIFGGPDGGIPSESGGLQFHEGDQSPHPSLDGGVGDHMSGNMGKSVVR